MKIGIIGSGNMGAGLGALWAAGGHNARSATRATPKSRPVSLKRPGRRRTPAT
jgi:predicted dinucleotide-binding enzyme